MFTWLRGHFTLNTRGARLTKQGNLFTFNCLVAFGLAVVPVLVVASDSTDAVTVLYLTSSSRLRASVSEVSRVTSCRTKEITFVKMTEQKTWKIYLRD